MSALRWTCLAVSIAAIAGCGDSRDYIPEPGDPLKNLEKLSGLALPESVTVALHGSPNNALIESELDAYEVFVYYKDPLDIKKRANADYCCEYNSADDLRQQTESLRHVWPKMPPVVSLKYVSWNRADYKFNADEAQTSDGCYAHIVRIRQGALGHGATSP